MADPRLDARKAWWPAALVVAACAAALGRPGNARSDPDGSRVAYVCLGDLAVDLTGGAADPPADRSGFAIASEEALQGCRLPHVPPLRGARPLVSARTRDGTWGLVAEDIDARPQDAMAKKRAALAAGGWRETMASTLLSEREPDSGLAAFERGGAWLLVVAVPFDDAGKSAIVAAGGLAPVADRRQP
ncbi:MAG: hypothetical protein PHU25_06290 [Deltaproteobacteria bacterium]|nr:hypothetical protein [Deltaproteobacteria bacterium]